MMHFKRQTFLPGCLSLLLALFIFMMSPLSIAAESTDYTLYERIFNTFEMETIEHSKIKLKDLSSDTIIVNFWTSWCIPCLLEMPSLITLSNKFTKKELLVVAINTDEENQLKNIMKIKKQLNFPESFIIVPDSKFRIADEFKFSAIPVTVIFKKEKLSFSAMAPSTSKRCH